MFPFITVHMPLLQTPEKMLLEAATGGRTKRIIELLDARVNINTTDEVGKTVYSSTLYLERCHE